MYFLVPRAYSVCVVGVCERSTGTFNRSAFTTCRKLGQKVFSPISDTDDRSGQLHLSQEMASRLKAVPEEKPGKKNWVKVPSRCTSVQLNKL